MKLAMGGQFFDDVTVPVLWGTRAVLQDRGGRLSVTDLGGSAAHPEIIADEVAPGVRSAARDEGYTIVGANDEELYTYSPSAKRLGQSSTGLPDVEVRDESIRVGSSVLAGNVIRACEVGIACRGRCGYLRCDEIE